MNLPINPPKKEEKAHVLLWHESPSQLLFELVVELRLHLSRNRVGPLPLLLGHRLGSLLGSSLEGAGLCRRPPFPEKTRMRTKAAAA
jgi:hypothetical protein